MCSLCRARKKYEIKKSRTLDHRKYNEKNNKISAKKAKMRAVADITLTKSQIGDGVLSYFRNQCVHLKLGRWFVA